MQTADGVYRTSIEIEALPEKIFAYMADPKRAQSWQPDADLRVDTMTKNECIAYRLEMPRASAYVEYRLVRWGRYTRVVSTSAVRPKGFLASLYPLLSVLIDKIAQWKMESRLELLRTAVESHA
jgi:hypothetical protein